jgi:hypothetical protein
MLTIIMVVIGKKQLKLGRSMRMSPGRRPNQLNLSPANHKISPIMISIAPRPTTALPKGAIDLALLFSGTVFEFVHFCLSD